MSQITTHILDTSIGSPAEGVTIRLEQQNPAGAWQEMASGKTNQDGRIMDLLPSDFVIIEGLYRMIFLTSSYFEKQGVSYFYPEIEVRFLLQDPDQHYHIPLLLNPFGYSTYRGS